MRIHFPVIIIINLYTNKENDICYGNSWNVSNQHVTIFWIKMKFGLSL